MLSRVCNREDRYAITHKEEGFFEISENKFPSKITRDMVCVNYVCFHSVAF